MSNLELAISNYDALEDFKQSDKMIVIKSLKNRPEHGLYYAMDCSKKPTKFDLQPNRPLS